MAMGQSEMLVLASNSATRRTMLANAGIGFEAQASNVDEDKIKQDAQEKGWSCGQTALALARAKAADISAARKGRLVLGADQMLECEGAWLNKAGDEAAAKAQLRFLSGKPHQLVTAASLMRDGQEIWQHVEMAELAVRPLSDSFIEGYVREMGKSLLGSVGCYAMEGLGAQILENVKGDYFTILGLPLLPLLAELRRLNVLAS